MVMVTQPVGKALEGWVLPSLGEGAIFVATAVALYALLCTYGRLGSMIQNQAMNSKGEWDQWTIITIIAWHCIFLFVDVFILGIVWFGTFHSQVSQILSLFGIH